MASGYVNRIRLKLTEIILCSEYCLRRRHYYLIVSELLRPFVFLYIIKVHIRRYYILYELVR